MHTPFSHGHLGEKCALYIKSNQIYLLKTSHLRVAIDKTVDEQGRQGSKEHLQ